MLLKPMGPSLTCWMRYEVFLQGAAGASNATYNIGADITGLNDFTNFANVFSRFTIKQAKFVVYPVLPVVN